MSFNTINRLIFSDSVKFFRFSSDCFVKNLGKNGFKDLSTEFDSNILDLINQKRLSLFEFISDFEKLKYELLSNKSFIVLLLVENAW